MTLVQTLKEFTNGKLSRAQLLAALDGPLNAELSDTQELTRVIDEVSRWEGFPDDITDVLKTRLADLSQGTFSEPSLTSFSDQVLAYRGTDRFAFVCCADPESASVQDELRWFNERGLYCYYEDGHRSQSELSAEAAARIVDSELFIYLVTGASADAERCRRQLAHALENNKKVLTVHLEDTKLPPALEIGLSGVPSIKRYAISQREYEQQFSDALEALDLSVLVSTVFDPSMKNQLPGTELTRDLQVGDVLAGRFRLEEVLGSGGMSIVYKARDLDSYDQSFVAVKVLNPDFSKHPDSIVTLKREVAKTSKLVDRNIVNVRDFGEVGPHAYMWMEYIPGRSLAERFRDPEAPPISTGEALIILEGMVKALSYAHEFRDEQIVHADLKPGNVMLTREPVTHPDQVRIIDFGIARAVKDSESGHEPTIYDIRSLRAHTPAYASPELIANKEADPRDDVYALGCIACELLTGRHPFDRRSATEAMAKGLNVQRRKGMTRDQYLAIRHALAFDRNHRTPSAAAFLRELNGQRSRLSPGLMRGVAAAAVAAVVGVAGWQIAGFLTPEAPAETFTDCELCPTMQLLPAGRFLQGGDGASFLASETPSREVTIAGPIAAGISEVTVAQFREFVESTGYQASGCYRYDGGSWSFDAAASWENPGFPQTDEHPVTCVSWRDATAYVQWLSERTGHAYRLPSESEWEYLAKAGTAGGRWFDETGVDTCTAANVADASTKAVYPDWQVSGCRDGYVYTAPADASMPNPFGLRDTVGNVFEWVQDCWHPNYRDAPVDGSARESANCPERVLRGGSWYSRPEYTTATFRNRFYNGRRASTFGFRVISEQT